MCELLLFNSRPISIMRSGRWEGDTERLCAMEARLLLERFPLPAGLEVRTA